MTNEASLGHGHDEGNFFLFDIAGNERKKITENYFGPDAKRKFLGFFSYQVGGNK